MKNSGSALKDNACSETEEKRKIEWQGTENNLRWATVKNLKKKIIKDKSNTKKKE